MFPHVVTVFNSYEDDDLKMRYSVTILRGVLLDVSKGTNVAKTGLIDADAATLYIPFSVEAVSTTGDKKTYVDPKVFYAAKEPMDARQRRAEQFHVHILCQGRGLRNDES